MQLHARLAEYPLEQVAARAAQVEAMGGTGTWVAEVNHDPFLLAGLAASATRTVRLGNNVAISFARSPFATALAAWDLQRLSAGRYSLGLGTSNRPHVEGRYSTDFERPVARIVDYVRCVRAIWRTFQEDAPPTYAGEFYRFTVMESAFNPGPLAQPEIPIYLAAATPMGCRAAGAVGDGLHVAPMHSAVYLREVLRPNLDTGARRQGRSAAEMGIGIAVITATGETQAELDAAVEGARRTVAFYGSLTPYRDMLTFHGHGDLGPRLAALAARGDGAGMAACITDPLLEHFALVAQPAQLAGKLRERYGDIADFVSLRFPSVDMDRRTLTPELIAAVDGG